MKTFGLHFWENWTCYNTNILSVWVPTSNITPQCQPWVLLNVSGLPWICQTFQKLILPVCDRSFHKMNSSFLMNHDKPSHALSEAWPLQPFIFKRKRPASILWLMMWAVGLLALPLTTSLCVSFSTHGKCVTDLLWSKSPHRIDFCLNLRGFVQAAKVGR